MGILDKPTTVNEDTEVSPQNQVWVDTTVSLEESKNVEEENISLSPLVAYIQDKFEKSKTRRYTDEQRWLEAYNNFRGVYGPDTQFTDTEKSQIFIKVTKTKVLAAYAQIQDVLFAGGRFPIGIEASKVPTNVADAVHFDPQNKEPPVPSTVARMDILGPLRKVLPQQVADKLTPGAGGGPDSVTFSPADYSAKKMEKRILDQLDESEAGKHLRFFGSELCLFGTGIMKGPFSYVKEYPKWDEEGNYSPIQETIPKSTSVSIWNFYPDSEARNMEDCECTIERHRYSKYQLRALKKRPTFRKDSINEAIMKGPNYTPEYWESLLDDSNVTEDYSQYEVLEFWGMVDRELLDENDLDIPEELAEYEDFEINAWVCNGIILRLVLNPFTPTRIPYYAVPYEMNPYSFFGIGVAENMADTQLVMNGVMRLAIDNLALAGNLIFEINEDALVPGQSMDVYPGKIFRRSGGAPGQALFGTKFPSVTNELMQLYDKARQLTDESTGMPSYAHGGIGVNGMGRTASGMSMLMGAAAQTIKAVVRNIDDYLLSPWGNAYFQFNMQFNFDKDIVGDLAVVARGTESLMRNEVRSQRILQFLQVTANPLDAPFVKRDYLLREFATSLDLDEDKMLNDLREAKIYAAIMKESGAMQGMQGKQAQGVNTQDETGTGGGNIMPGNAPEPNSQGFTGSGGGDNGTSSRADSASVNGQ